MKVTPLSPLYPARQAGAQAKQEDKRVSRSDRVDLSSTAAWISEVRERTMLMPEVRQEAVASARQDIDSGELDSDANLDAAVNALVREL